MTTEAIVKLPDRAETLLRERHACAPLASLAIIKASGPAIGDYLQGQMTQDIALLAPDRAIYAAVLTPQGKAVADIRLLAGHGGELVILTEAARAEALVGRLRRFSVGYEARIGLVDALAVVAVQGPGTNAALARAGLPVPAAQVNDVAAHPSQDLFCLRLPMAAMDGVLLVAARADCESHMKDLDGAIEARDMETARILNGFPRFGVDWDESVHPLNANLIERHGVSFDKGCYVGQEVTSRMRWRGQIKWRLCRIGLTRPVPNLPCAVEAGDRMGDITSLAMTAGGDTRGIARLRIEAVEAGRRLEAAGRRVEVLGHAQPV